MTISVVQATGFADAATGSFASNVTAGNTVLLAMTGYATSNVTISTSSPLFGGTAVTAASQLISEQSAWDGGLTAYTSVWLLPDLAGGAASVALTYTNGSLNGNTGLYAYEVAGLGSAAVLDQSAGNSATSGVCSSGASGAITSSPELILGVSAQNGVTGGAAPSGFTCQNVNPGNWTSSAGYDIVASSGGSYTYAVSTGGNEWAAAVVTLAVTPAPPVQTQVLYSMRVFG